MRRAGWVLGSVLVASVCTVSVAASEPLPLNIKLDNPRRVTLNAAQIESHISAKRLLLDESAIAPYVQLNPTYIGGCPPEERFYPDGSWEEGICERAYRVYHGHWRIQSDGPSAQLCTTPDGQEEYCRFVWPRTEPDRLILSAEPMPGEGGHAYNLYRTEPLTSAKTAR